jgi:hypothetical protein
MPLKVMTNMRYFLVLQDINELNWGTWLGKYSFGIKREKGSAGGLRKKEAVLTSLI